jgi:ornithine--oxo-acid transaminase
VARGVLLPGACGRRIARVGAVARGGVVARDGGYMSTSREYLAEAEHYGAHNYHPLPVVLERGEGVYVWDVEGKRYLDMLSAYSALNQGHRHPRILAALMGQAERLTLTSRAFNNDRLGPFLHRLCDVAGYERALPMNTGAEAIETAIKAARKWAMDVKGLPENEGEILVFTGNFHGRTITATSLSSEPLYRRGFGPFTPGFRLVPYGDLAAARDAFSDRTIGVLVEPIQGEAGVVVPPEGFLRGLAGLCRDHGALLLADEIQTGLGRCGRLFASEWEGVRPDIAIIGKALGGGMIPVSAILADSAIMDVFTPGTHGSTFGGNPLAAAVGIASLDVIVEEKLPERADATGRWFMDRLRAMRAPVVREIRGRGLLVGVVIREEAGPARSYCEALMQRGILAKETHEQVVRFAPPLIVTQAQLEEVLPAIEETLAG